MLCNPQIFTDNFWEQLTQNCLFLKNQTDMVQAATLVFTDTDIIYAVQPTNIHRQLLGAVDSKLSFSQESNI
jgi:hypothetical protein